MADTFRVIVDVRGDRDLRTARTHMAAIERSADRIGPLLRRAFAFGAIAGAATALARASDEITNINNRIRITTNSTREFNRVYRQLFQVAQDTRSELSGTAQVYGRLAISLRQFGFTNRDTIGLVRNLNQAVAISGASFQEARAALIQFSQGVASGTLRGDELRSVLEQLPFVADVIARRFRVTRGELRALAATGAIVPEEILEAFRDAQDEIEERFRALVPTISQGATAISNAFLQYVRGANEATNISSTLAFALQGLSRILDPILDSLTVAGLGFGAVFGARALSRLSTRTLLGPFQERAQAQRLLDSQRRSLSFLSPAIVNAARTDNINEDRFGRLGSPVIGTASDRRGRRDFPQGSLTAAFLGPGGSTRPRRGIESGLIATTRQSLRQIDTLQGQVARSAGILGSSIAFGLGGLAVSGVIALTSYFIGLRQQIERTRLETNELIESAEARQREGDRIRAGLEIGDDQFPLPDESRSDATTRIAEQARRNRVSELEEQIERDSEALDTFNSRLDTLNLQRASLLSRRQGFSAGELAALDEEIGTVSEAATQSANNLVATAAILHDLETGTNDYGQALAGLRVDLGLNDTAIGRIERKYAEFRATQEIAGVASDSLARSLTFLSENGVNVLNSDLSGLNVAIIEYLRTGGGPLNEESRQLIDNLLSVQRGLDGIDFRSTLAEGARQARQELESLNSQFDSVRSRLLFNFSQRGATDREREINRTLGISTLVEEERFNQRSDATALRRLAGEEVDRERARREQEQRDRESQRRREAERRSAFEELERDALDSFARIQEEGEAVFGNVENSIVELVMTGKTSFKDLVSSILADITRLSVQRSIVGPLFNAFTGAGGFSGILAGGGFGRLFTDPSTGFFGSGRAAPGTFSTATFAGSFQQGGIFTVPGSGGPDSQFIALRASPGEQISLTPQGERRGGNAGRGQRPIVVNLNLPAGTNIQELRRSRKQIGRLIQSAAQGA